MLLWMKSIRKSRNDILVAFVVAGALPDQFSAGQTTAINRLLSGEVPAAVLALVSPDAAEGFPDVAGFKVFQFRFYRDKARPWPPNGEGPKTCPLL